MKNKNLTISYYDQKAHTLTERYESADVNELQQALLTTLHNCKNLLELGCGSGREASFLLKNQPETSFTITDGSKEMLSKAAKLHEELTPFLKILNLPEDLTKIEEKYDGIYSVAALMHLRTDEIKVCFKHISDKLLPNGILFISVSTSRENQPPEDPRTFTLKNKSWWIQQVEEVGLSVKSAYEKSDGLNRENTIWLNLTALKR